MQRPPRAQGSGVIGAADWLRIIGVGAVMMIGTLAVLDAYYPGGLLTLYARGTGPNAPDEAYARTMVFTTLMMFQLVNVFNCRATWRSAFSGFFENRWLIGAVALSLFTHVLVIYVPVLQTAFHSAALSAFDWLILTGVAVTLLAVMELVKLALRFAAPRRAGRPSMPFGRVRRHLDSRGRTSLS